MQITQYSTRRVTLLEALNVNTELLQHYNPRNMVCVGYVVENTLRKIGGGSGGGGRSSNKQQQQEVTRTGE